MQYLTMQITAVVLMLIGVFGVIVPFLPGIPFMLIISLCFAYLDKFTHITNTEIIILIAIGVISIVVDYFSGVVGSRIFGSSKRGAVGGFIGLLLGLLIASFWGMLIGLVLGVFLVEVYYGKDKKIASKAALGGLLGSVFGVVINLFLAILFIVLFIIFSI